MDVDVRSALGVPAGSEKSTKQLVGSISNLETALMSLQQVAAQTSPDVQSSVHAFISSTRQIVGELTAIASGIGAFCTQINEFTSKAASMSAASIKLQVAQLGNDASSVEQACKASGANLATYRDQANTIISNLKTESERLKTKNEQLAADEKQLEDELHALLADDNVCDQIVHSFQLALGDLMSDINSAIGEIKQDTAEIRANTITMAGLAVLANRLVVIVAAASELEVSWRSLGDTIGALGADLGSVTPAMLAGDLAYVNSDWQAVQAIVDRVR